MNLFNNLFSATVLRATKLTLVLSATALLSTACGNTNTGVSGLSGSSDQIIGGKDATGAEDFAQHTVGLYDAKIQAICTASILSDKLLVTAAHCVESEPAALRVVFGTDFNSKSIKVQKVEAYRVSPIWATRQNEALNTGDIAIVKFSGGLPAGFKPTKFLTDAKMLADDMDVMLAGFGASKVVMERDPKTGQIFADHQDSGRLRYTTTTIKKAAFTQTEFLTESSKGTGACHGDSGGPAYVKVGGEMVLTGVTSRSYGDANDTCSVAATYTSIPYYATWIASTAKTL